MKKKITIALFACAVCAGAFTLSFDNSSGMSDLMCDNVEALAAGEGNSSCSATANCFKEIWEEGKQKTITTGIVSCSGTEECKSGYQGNYGWVDCDGNISSCSDD